MNTHHKVYVAGHRGMVGSAIVRRLLADGLPAERIVCRTHAELDLTDQACVRAFFDAEKPAQVYLAAAKVGGIHANNVYPAEFIYENLMIEANVVDAAFRSGVRKMLFLGAGSPHPGRARGRGGGAAPLGGRGAPTNGPNATTKLGGSRRGKRNNRQYGKSHGVDYRSVMPTNLYGLGDNYHPENSHVIPALIRRFHEAKLAGAPFVSIWGSGTPKREFLYVDDMAAACVHVMGLDRDVYAKHTQPMLSHINVGCGADVTIRELAEAVAHAVDYRGRLEFDTQKPDGAPRKLMNSERLNTLGWQAKIGLEEGLASAYADFLRRNTA